MMFLIILNACIFFSLAGIHFYWAFGGKIDIQKVVPAIEGRDLALRPPTIATLVVAIGLLGFGLVMIANTGLFEDFVSKKVVFYLTWGIGLIFLLRAIGDFKYLGFFKKIKNTPFANYDSKYYAPLCLVLSIGSILIANMA